MFTLKHLEETPTCFDLIQIIFRELICSLLKSQILKFVKNVKVNARAHTKCYAAASPH